jgi:hypothetical protein
MNMYRICTENKRKKWICNLVAGHFGGFTVYKTMGYYKGQREKSLVIEIVTDSPADSLKIIRICKSICGQPCRQSEDYQDM